MSATAASAQTLMFPISYDAILERIHQIDPIQYGKTRNYLDGAVTLLSPYISRGVISTKQVRDITLARGFDRYAIQKFLQELAWREYFQRVWQVKKERIFHDLHQPQANIEHRLMIEAIEQAATGIEAVDRGIRSLYETGYLHNHLRMYVASLACNIGKAHWYTPARWMYAHLLDGDLASNTCSWQWVAGTFSKKKYFCNQDNINNFTRSQQTNTFLDASVEELSNVPVPPSFKITKAWNLATTLPSTPTPHLDVTRPTLLYHSYNLDPLWHQGEDANRVLLLEPSHFRKFPVSEKVMSFILALAQNIPGIQIMVGEVVEFQQLLAGATGEGALLISKEHPAFDHFPGIKEERDWLFPGVTGYHPSFFSFWKKCAKSTVVG